MRRLLINSTLCRTLLALAALALCGPSLEARSQEEVESGVGAQDEAGNDAASAAGGSAADLAKQLANPIASLISLPFQLNWDTDIGPVDDGDRYTLNIQPVIPLSINDDWNMISRTILPVVDQQDIFPGAGDQFGIGDIVQSLFFSPKETTASGWTWGVGPVFLLPTGSDDLLTTDQWGLGPTAVALKQNGPVTVGGLINHIVSVAGDDDRPDVNSTFLQPFYTYTTPSAVSYTVAAEATYDWESEQWNIPLGVFIGKVTSIGKQLVQVTGGPRYYVESTDGGPEGLGFRFMFVLLFPKG